MKKVKRAILGSFFLAFAACSSNTGTEQESEVISEEVIHEVESSTEVLEEGTKKMGEDVEELNKDIDSLLNEI